MKILRWWKFRNMKQLVGWTNVNYQSTVSCLRATWTYILEWIMKWKSESIQSTQDSKPPDSKTKNTHKLHSCIDFWGFHFAESANKIRSSLASSTDNCVLIKSWFARCAAARSVKMSECRTTRRCDRRTERELESSSSTLRPQKS